MGVCTKVNAQRKFIDLINEATFKWANWDPPRVIQIGDFGTIDKKSGELKVEGNIFTHPEIWHIAQDYPAFVAPETDLYQIHSSTTDVGAAQQRWPGVVLKSRWQFNTKHGAILLMHKSRLLCVVVKQVHNCRGFYMYLSNKASEQISVSLRANTLPGVDGEQALFVGWSADGSSGVCQQGFREDAVYTPMFRLKSLGRRHWRRDGIIPMIE
ncbi:hypothetical protein EDB84DRAFT_1467214, partial [Lactarius hengduanensis]